jgi:hypothetical protein
MRAVVGSIVVALSIAQTSTQPFVGTWTAEHAGTTFVRLELRRNRSALEGNIALGNIHVDANGEVDGAEPPSATPTPIADVAVNGSTVTFSHTDGADIDRFEVRVIDDTSAELRFVLPEEARQELAAANVPIPKPIRLKKTP